jgi:hypothetical protein
MAATRSPLTLSRASAPTVSLAGKASVATLATFQIPKVDNEPNVISSELVNPTSSNH